MLNSPLKFNAVGSHCCKVIQHYLYRDFLIIHHFISMPMFKALGRVRTINLSVITAYLRKFLLALWMVTPIICVLDLLNQSPS